MASKGEKSTKSSEKPGKSAKRTAAKFLSEAEKTGEAVLNEVRQRFDALIERAGGIAGKVAETTATATKATRKETAHLVGGLLDEVKEAGETSARVIGDRFDALRRRVLSSAEAAPGKKTSGKKAASKKKAAVKKKAVVKKTATKRRAPVAKRAGTKKAVPAARKATTKKKAAPAKRAGGSE